jgi:glutamyl-tRNA synthetase
VPGLAEAALEDLHWLGLDWDEGDEDKGPHVPYAQSNRSRHYEEALDVLHTNGRLFPCALSRKDLQGLASAPHVSDGSIPAYPPNLRPKEVPKNWFENLRHEKQPREAIRFLVDTEPIRFSDLVYGEVVESVDKTVGDFVLKRRDRFYAYQLAVVVDDYLMGINEVVRGADLLSSTARQIQLFEALGAPIPQFAHVPLVLNAEAAKISKRDGGLTLNHLRSRGITSEQVTGYLAWSIGLLPEPNAARPQDLVVEFQWEKIGREDWMLPPNVEEVIGRIR